MQAIKTVADRLGNTTSVCRKCYIHPVVFDAYMSGDVITPSKRRARSRSRLSSQEAAVVDLIERWAGKARQAGRAEKAGRAARARRAA